MLFDIVSIGNINIDLLFYIERLPIKDSEAYAKGFMISHGGSAANFAFSASRLGKKVAMVGCVGDDSLGAEGVKELKEAGVECCKIVRVAGKPTGAVCVLVDRRGGRRMIAYRGANEGLASIVGGEIPKAKVVHVSNVTKGVLATVLKARVGGIISLDPGGEAKRLGMESLEGVDVLLLNEQECKDLTGVSLREGADALAKMVGTVVIKRGKHGAYLAQRNQTLSQPPFAVTVMDTTGAGDSFDAGFLSGLLEGRDLDTCLRFGQAVAAMKIRGRGARSNLPSMGELIEFLEKNAWKR